MKICLNEPILDFEEKPLERNNKIITYGSIIRDVLGAPKEKESGEEKLKRFNLGLKAVADEVDLSLDERSLIKKLVNDFGLNPIIFGRICQLFEEPQEKSAKNGKEKQTHNLTD